VTLAFTWTQARAPCGGQVARKRQQETGTAP